MKAGALELGKHSFEFHYVTWPRDLVWPLNLPFSVFSFFFLVLFFLVGGRGVVIFIVVVLNARPHACT